MDPNVFRTSAPEASDALISDPTQSWTLALTTVAALLVGLDALVVSTALSPIRTELGASPEQLEWSVNAYVLSFAVLMMTAPALGDRCGRRRLFVVSACSRLSTCRGLRS
jgi:MFS family permease